jgi:hypothetical protein
MEKYNKEQEQVFRMVIAKILDKAMSNDTFRNLCLSDSKKAFKEVTNKDWPTDAPELLFVENQENMPKHAIFIPGVSEELTEDDLEQVAGGIVAPQWGGTMMPAYGAPGNWNIKDWGNVIAF